MQKRAGSSRRRKGGVALAAGFLLVCGSAQAQSRGPSSLHVTAGSHEESYLRTLQIMGIAPEYPWSLRAFSRSELDSLSHVNGSHPWSSRYTLAPGVRSLSLIPIDARTVVNSAFPWGVNDGPVWAGRGATVSVSAGVHGGRGPFSFSLNPIAFSAMNADFALAPNGQAGPLSYGDPQFSAIVDLPQRFGDEPYTRIDPGNSYVRLDWMGAAAGLSTANEFWGPAAIYPFILGNNAPGFLHGFVGTSRPVNVGIGRTHFRVQWGRLEQSAYSPVTGSSKYISPAEPGHSRFAPGLVLILQPRGATGLELGISRFFHLFLPAGGVPGSYWTKPFQNLFRQNNPAVTQDSLQTGDEANQLASVFMRWVFAGAGVEVYAEYGREDYNADLRDAIQEPDHQRSYMLGAAKALKTRSGRLHSVRAEVMNFQIPALARTRNQGETYAHGKVRQGHTHRGQLLGSPVGVDAAAGSSLLWESYSSSGKWALRWSRTVRRERGRFHETGIRESRTIDAAQELDASTTWFTRLGDVSLGGAIVREFNRNFGEDAWNAQARLALRRGF